MEKTVKRLTYVKCPHSWDRGEYPTKYTSRHTFQEVVDRLAAYEDTGLEPKQAMLISNVLREVGETYNCWFDYVVNCILENSRLKDIAKAEKDGRLVVLEPAAREGEKKPPCFYNDMGQALCLGFARGEYDDESIDGCKECWYCESTREDAEAALKKGEEADNEAD